MTLRGPCRVRPLRSADWLPGSLDVVTPRFIQVSAWTSERLVTIVVFWLYRSDLAPNYTKGKSLLTVVREAVARRDPQLTALPDHDHDGVLVYRWAGCFIFTPDSVMAKRIRGALEDEAWLAEQATAAK